MDGSRLFVILKLNYKTIKSLNLFVLHEEGGEVCCEGDGAGGFF